MSTSPREPRGSRHPPRALCVPVTPGPSAKGLPTSAPELRVPALLRLRRRASGLSTQRSPARGNPLASPLATARAAALEAAATVCFPPVTSVFMDNNDEEHGQSGRCGRAGHAAPFGSARSSAPRANARGRLPRRGDGAFKGRTPTNREPGSYLSLLWYRDAFRTTRFSHLLLPSCDARRRHFETQSSKEKSRVLIRRRFLVKENVHPVLHRSTLSSYPFPLFFYL